MVFSPSMLIDIVRHGYTRICNSHPRKLPSTRMLPWYTTVISVSFSNPTSRSIPNLKLRNSDDTNNTQGRRHKGMRRVPRLHPLQEASAPRRPRPETRLRPTLARKTPHGHVPGRLRGHNPQSHFRLPSPSQEQGAFQPRHVLVYRHCRRGAPRLRASSLEELYPSHWR